MKAVLDVKTRYLFIVWAVFGGLLLVAILLPFFLFGERIEQATRAFLEARPADWKVALLLGALQPGQHLLGRDARLLAWPSPGAG